MFKLKIISCIIVAALAIFQAGCVPQGQELEFLSSLTPGNSGIESMSTVPSSIQQGTAVQSSDDPLSSDPDQSSASSSPSGGSSAPAGPDQGLTTGPSGGSVAGSSGIVDTEHQAGWQTYIDEKFDFTINYPQSYTPEVNPQRAQDSDPIPVHQVRFQEDLGDANFVWFDIEVFENGAGASLEEWVNAYAPVGSRTLLPVGNLSGYQVTKSIEIAPNQFYYVAEGSYIYKLTPQGPYGQEMLNSFKLK